MRVKRKPRWYHGWNIVAVCMMSSMAGIALTVTSFSLFLPSWTAQFDASVSSIALAITIFSFGVALLSYLIGHWSGQYPAKRVIGGALFALGLSHLAMAAVDHLWQMFAIYALVFPLAIGCCTAIPSQALVSRWFARRSGLAMGLTATGLAAGGIVFPPIVVAVLPLIGWRTIWAGFGLLILLVILPIALLVLRDRPDDDDPFDYIARPAAGVSAAASLPLSQVVRNRNYLVVVAAFLAVQCVGMVISVAIGPILVTHGGTMADAGIFLSVYSASALVAKLLSGWLADRIGSRIPMAVATIGGALAMFMLALLEVSFGLIVLTALVGGISGAVWTLLASSVLGEFGPASFARAFGLACGLAPVGTLVPPIVARVAEVTGSYDGSLMALGAITTVAALAMLVLFRAPHPQATAAPRPA